MLPAWNTREEPPPNPPEYCLAWSEREPPPRALDGLDGSLDMEAEIELASCVLGTPSARGTPARHASHSPGSAGAMSSSSSSSSDQGPAMRTRARR